MEFGAALFKFAPIVLRGIGCVAWGRVNGALERIPPPFANLVASADPVEYVAIVVFILLTSYDKSA